MDGGSTDDSVKIIKAFAKRNTGKVKWRSRKDRGQVYAVNEGILKSKGEVVAYINSDDYYVKDCFQKVYDFFLNSNNLWLYGNCLVSEKKLAWTFLYKWIWRVDKFGSLLYLLNMVNQPSVFIKKTLIGKVGLFDTKLKLAFDYDYWLRCLRFEKPKRINASLSVFRVHKKSKSSEQFEKQFNEELMILKKHKVNSALYYLHMLHNFFIVLAYKFLK